MFPLASILATISVLLAADSLHASGIHNSEWESDLETSHSVMANSLVSILDDSQKPPSH